ncbi:XIAP-associated factor 1 [Silurus asotus]|uniref:XIAP-associated factor 1 n=1 Tax=Silurus asotus TaxID=30991 RepID=A0AAD5B2U3_SILAS|nr:XIAP-associated factor 1 [Silurus asotus]
MDTAEELDICVHCKKEVVKTNLPVHEAHCQRFLCLCPDCDDQVPKDQLEEHRKERHTVIKCKKCNLKMENCKLADHEANDCTKRLESCEFCQMDLPWSDLKEHTVACGSRTELCPDCKKYVRLKDQLQHANICSSEEDFSFKHNKNVKPLPVNTLQDDQLDTDLTKDWRDYRDIRGAESEPEDTVLSLSDLQKKKRNEKKENRVMIRHFPNFGHVGEDSRKRKYKSPRNNHGNKSKSMARIYQLMFSQRGPFVNTPKRPQNDLEDETPVSVLPAKTRINSSNVKHPAIVSGVVGDTSETVTNQPKPSVRTEHRKCKHKSPRHGDNDDNNFETMAQIRQQMYSPGGPYYNVAHHKQPHDDLEDKDESPVSQPPAKIRSDSSYVENPAVSKLTVDTSEPKPSNSQLESSVTEVPCTEQRKSPCDADDASNIHKTTIMIRQILDGLNYTVSNRERPQDDLQDQDESSFGPGGRYYNMANDHNDESPVSDDTSETVTNQPKPSVRTEHRKCKHKSPRHGNNDDNNFETMAQIRQQMYSPGGPYYNVAHCKRPHDDLEDKDESPVSQPPAKIRSDSSYVENPAVSKLTVDTSEPKPSNSQLESSVTEVPCTEQRKSPCDADDASNIHKTTIMIRQILDGLNYTVANHERPQDDLQDKDESSFGPGGRYYNIANDHNDESPVSDDTSETVTNQPKPSVRTEHRKCKRKSPRYGDNDDNNFETMAQIHKQMYGPGGPYYNLAHCKQTHDDLEDEDESPVSQPPAKTTKTDSSYIKNPSVFEFFVDPSEPKPSTNQLKSIFTNFPCTEQRESSCDADDASTVQITLIMNRLKLNGLCKSMAKCERPQDDLDHKGKGPVNQPPAKTVMIDSSHVDYPLVSGVSGETSETVTNEPKPSVRTEHCKCEHRSPRHCENGDNNFKTMAQFRQQMNSPGAPFYNMAHRKRPQDDLEDKEESSVSQSPAKTTRTDLLYSKNPAIFRFFDDTSEPKPSTSQLKSSFTKFSCNEQRKSPCDADDTINVHKTAMIHQTLDSLYYTVANHERLQDDLQDKDESPIHQPPAKTVMIDTSYVKHSLVSGVVGDTSETVTNQPMSSVRTEHRKCKHKSPRHGDNDDNNFETMAQIRQQMYGPGGPYYNVAHHKRPHDDLEDKDECPVSQPPAKIRSDSSYVENPAVSKLTVDTSEPKPSNSQLESSVTEVPCTEQRKSPCDADDASNIHKTTVMIQQP